MRISLKRFFSLFLTASLLLLTFSLVACNDSAKNESTPLPSSPKNDEEEPSDPSTDNGEDSENNENNDDNNNDGENTEDGENGDGQPSDEPISLDGKRVIFIGNSHTYYGKTVINTSKTSQSARTGDKGMFYHLCKLNGQSVTVTNWTFANHNLSDCFGGTCTKCSGSINHENDLIDPYYDYVIIQEGSSEGTPETFLPVFERAYNFFKQANPNVKFIFTLSTRAVRGNYAWISAVDGLKESHGISVLYLGQMIWNVVDGKLAVENATETYNQNSFIICKSATDGYHPNLLTGYLTALFVYCGITGESAVGQPYSFAIDPSVNSAFDPDSFISSYYTYNKPTTNFVSVLKSDADMKGLQALVDRYLRDKD